MGTDERLADAIIDILNPRSRSLLSPPTAGTIMLAPAPELVTPAAVTSATTTPVEDNSNAIDVASSPVAEELAPAPNIPTTPVVTKTEPEYIDPPEFEDDDEVEEDKIPF